MLFLFQLLEENIAIFMKNELKRFQRFLKPDYPECLKGHGQSEEEDGDHGEQRESFLRITLHFLRRMQQAELADRLQGSKTI